MLIDTHCHLNDPKAFPDPDAEIETAKQAGVDRMIVIGTRPDEWPGTIELVERHPELYAALGWHPNYTAEYDPGRLVELRHHLQHPKVLAVGEIGLDYHWDYSPPEIQKRALRDQLDLAVREEMPMVFHARNAYADLIDILEEYGVGSYLFHCFTGAPEDAARAVALGAYFGVDGPVTYKNADALRATIRGIPVDRLVVETDAPYMAPVPFRGKLNRPAYVAYVNAAMASVLGLSVDDCARLTTANAERFFRIAG